MTRDGLETEVDARLLLCARRLWFYPRSCEPLTSGGPAHPIHISSEESHSTLSLSLSVTNSEIQVFEVLTILNCLLITTLSKL